MTDEKEVWTKKIFISTKMGIFTTLAIKHQLKKFGYGAEHIFVPLSGVRRAIVLFDVEDAQLDECQKIASEFFSGAGIAYKPFFLDMGKHGKDDIITTGVKTTILRRNLAFCGTLPGEIIGELQSEPAELYICLTDRDCPAVRCFNGIVPATFCIGRRDYPGSPFSMIFSTPEEDNIQVNFHDSTKCLQNMLEYLKKIV